MSLVRIGGPHELVVSLQELRAHLRIGDDEDADQDALIIGYARAAQDAIDGAGGWLGRALTTQSWQLKLDCFAWPIEVPLPPCQSITSIRYVDDQGATQTLDSSLYQVTGAGGASPARIWPAYGEDWPSTRQQPEAVTVEFVAGYGGHSDVPEVVRQAIYLTVKDYYDQRGSIMAGDGFERLKVTPAAENLLLPLRVW